MIKNIKLFIVIVIAYVLQTTIISDFNILGIFPNLFLIVVCGIAFLFGSTVGGTFGFAFGLLLDLTYGRAIGLNAFLGMYIGIILGHSNKRFFKDNYIVAVTFTGIATFIYETVIYIFGMFAYNQVFSLGYFFVNILLMILVNVIASFIVYPILLKFNIGIELNRNIFGR